MAQDFLIISKEELKLLRKEWGENRPDENIYKAGILKCIDALSAKLDKQNIHAFDEKKNENGTDVFVGYNTITNKDFHFVQIPVK